MPPRLLFSEAQYIGVARGCIGCTCTPRAEKKMGVNLQGKVCAPPRQRVHPEAEQVIGEIGEIWTVGEVI